MWARGDYTQVGERLLPMGAALLDACERAVGGLTATRLVDAACGVGNAPCRRRPAVPPSPAST